MPRRWSSTVVLVLILATAAEQVNAQPGGKTKHALPFIAPPRPSQIVKASPFRTGKRFCEAPWGQIERAAAEAHHRSEEELVLRLGQPATVASIAGAPLRRILVQSACWQTDPPRNWAGVVRLMEDLFRRWVHGLATGPIWANWAVDAVAADLEFEGGAVGRIVTDGRRAILLDAHGRYWFFGE